MNNESDDACHSFGSVYFLFCGRGRSADSLCYTPLSLLMLRLLRVRHISCALVIVISHCAAAQTATFFNHWFQRVTKTQAEQPHWITPLVTVTPRLEEEYRFDVVRTPAATGATVNLGNNKGLELIPAERVEVIFGVPAYITHSSPSARDGWGDTSFLMKYRLFSAPRDHGDYIVTAFFSTTVPTGSYSNGSVAGSVTPTIAAGKGFGPVSVQSTLGTVIATSHRDTLGTRVVCNTALQYNVLKHFWPEVEANATFFRGGREAGENQLFLTPGLIVGRFHLYKRVGLTLGSGVQVAATRFHTSNHNWIWTLRLPF